MKIEITNKKFWIIISFLFIVAVLNFMKFYVEYEHTKDSLYGLYMKSHETIEVRIDTDFLDIQSYFYHELGHHVWFTVLNESERKEYEFIVHNNTDKIWKQEIKEDFAEWFKIYVMNQCGSMFRCNFIEDVIYRYELDLFYYNQNQIKEIKGGTN